LPISLALGWIRGNLELGRHKGGLATQTALLQLLATVSSAIRERYPAWAAAAAAREDAAMSDSEEEGQQGGAMEVEEEEVEDEELEEESDESSDEEEEEEEEEEEAVQEEEEGPWGARAVLVSHPALRDHIHSHAVLQAVRQGLDLVAGSLVAKFSDQLSTQLAENNSVAASTAAAVPMFVSLWRSLLHTLTALDALGPAAPTPLCTSRASPSLLLALMRLAEGAETKASLLDITLEVPLSAARPEASASVLHRSLALARACGSGLVARWLRWLPCQLEASAEMCNAFRALVPASALVAFYPQVGRDSVKLRALNRALLLLLPRAALAVAALDTGLAMTKEGGAGGGEVEQAGLALLLQTAATPLEGESVSQLFWCFVTRGERGDKQEGAYRRLRALALAVPLAPPGGEVSLKPTKRASKKSPSKKKVSRKRKAERDSNAASTNKRAKKQSRRTAK
jgi:hypothetical protein